ncbi:unnamed protein product [Dibothriocephalus latus]|uniref:Uncharacterized protein n=1 Tax=Dibothriocephalus latus TaxID=60516 RepID=A0A3P7MB72_DIBLA|nr:unnamed protein product [Dibothriocephalus latus]
MFHDEVHSQELPPECAIARFATLEREDPKRYFLHGFKVVLSGAAFAFRGAVTCDSKITADQGGHCTQESVVFFYGTIGPLSRYSLKAIKLYLSKPLGLESMGHERTRQLCGVLQLLFGSSAGLSGSCKGPRTAGVDTSRGACHSNYAN